MNNSPTTEKTETMGLFCYFVGRITKKKTNLGYWWKGVEVLSWGCLWVKAEAAVVPAFFARTE